MIGVVLFTGRVDLVVGVTASHAVGRGFASQTGHTKDHNKHGTYCLCLPALLACDRVGV